MLLALHRCLCRSEILTSPSVSMSLDKKLTVWQNVVSIFFYYQDNLSSNFLSFSFTPSLLLFNQWTVKLILSIPISSQQQFIDCELSRDFVQVSSIENIRLQLFLCLHKILILNYSLVLFCHHLNSNHPIWVLSGSLFQLSIHPFFEIHLLLLQNPINIKSKSFSDLPIFLVQVGRYSTYRDLTYYHN